MNQWLLIIIGTVCIIVLDYLFLGILMRNFYAQIPGRGDVRVLAAVLTWLCISIGIVFFALPKAVSWQTAVLFGAVFGFVLYAVYDLTNYAVLAQWPLRVVFVDIIWGTLLCAVTTAVLYLLQ